ncbi:MAG: hypothetical protein N5P05_001070 [Chroococcopsis gigantea SAG 12.99]|jgi:benzodiazapine receptor|nr:TspO/MBR family protein [Chlorogloea purpurea SAG 13.99]MDV2999464.1 hypothetical protein [Chroococcopsis gigantea SAG 12.99]
MFFLPSWLVIAVVAILVASTSSLLDSNDRRWFNRQIRPRWLTFERLIPFIWISIFICGAISAYLVWESGTSDRVFLMLFYLVVELAVMAYTPVMCKTRSLRVGTIIGALGFVLGCILIFLVFRVSFTAGLLLLPFVLWSPIGTYVTWEMSRLNQ